MHPRFPFITLATVFVPILPSPPDNFSIKLPFAPYLLDDRETEEEELDLPGWPAIVSACMGLFRNTSAPHAKSNMVNLKEVLKTDWRKDKRSKYIYPQVEKEVNITGHHEAAGESRTL